MEDAITFTWHHEAAHCRFYLILVNEGAVLFFHISDYIVDFQLVSVIHFHLFLCLLQLFLDLVLV